MKTYLIASTRESAGKTSFIVGWKKALNKKYGYVKPFGDRLIYQRKKNWDYDASLVGKLWELDADPDTLTLGFNHAKLRYVYDEQSVRKVLKEMIDSAAAGMDGVFIEGGKDICYGASIFLDSVTMASHTGAELIIIASGAHDVIMDDLYFVHKCFQMPPVNLKGVVINKVKDVEDFKDTYVKNLEELGIPVLGVIPYEEKLTYFSMQYLADALFAKVLGGEKGLGNIVKYVFVGATSAEACMRNPVFNRENKLIITSGDRDDVIVAALGSYSAGIILTNNIIPPSNIISMAQEQGIPLLLVANDTFQVAKQIDRLDALISPADVDKISLLAELVGKNIDRRLSE